MLQRISALVTIIVTLGAAARPTMAQQIAAERLTARDIPAALRLVGSVEVARRWTDRNGQNLLILTRTDEATTPSKLKDADPLRSQEIHGYHYVRAGSGYRLLWHTVDSERDCDLDLLVQYGPGSLQVTDVDRDGIAETTYIYRLSCQDGLEGADMKLILHEGATKYAIRGTQDLRDYGNGYPAPQMHVDPSFTAHPALRDFAVRQWRRFVRYSSWSDEGPP